MPSSVIFALCEYPGLSFQRCPVRACSLVSSLLLNGATMSQESSLTQSAHSVRQVLTAYSQHFVQRVMHRGSLVRVERVHGAHQHFERIARKRFLTFVCQSQTDASPIRLRSLSDQVPTCLKCLDRLRSGATGGRLKLRECRRGPGERVGTGEVAKRHPLGGAEFAVIALGLHKASRQQQELCRFASWHGHLSAK